jgi:2-oxoglutarate ferredoxin oxidoreductase subunit beta
MTTAATGTHQGAERPLTKKDFESGLSVRWCPGCGDYAILAQVQRFLAETGRPKEQFVFVSGIGCSSRFPYYMSTYGFHTIHGRATAIATGLKAARPDLSVWIATGDGDALSIGGNHFIHVLRRNPRINILLFNNRIYGLTKGQYSPTSEQGKITPSSPLGVLDRPFNTVALALGAQATFVARTIDRDLNHFREMLHRVYQHRGTSFLEIYQNCNIFNDGAFAKFTDKDTKPWTTVYLKHGQPLKYGPNLEKAIRLNGFVLETVDLTENPFLESDLPVHDEHSEHTTLPMILSGLTGEDGLPLALGVFRDIPSPSYTEGINEQIAKATEMLGTGDLDALLNSGDTWEVPPE